jgi:hypothetical protein
VKKEISWLSFRDIFSLLSEEFLFLMCTAQKTGQYSSEVTLFLLSGRHASGGYSFYR